MTLGCCDGVEKWNTATACCWVKPVDEIDDVTKANSVNQISNGSTEDKPHRDRGNFLFGLDVPDNAEPKNSQNCERHKDEENNPNIVWEAPKHSKCGTVVVNKGPAKPAQKGLGCSLGY